MAPRNRLLLKRSSNYLKMLGELIENTLQPGSACFWSPGKRVGSAYYVLHPTGPCRDTSSPWCNWERSALLLPRCTGGKLSLGGAARPGASTVQATVGTDRRWGWSLTRTCLWRVPFGHPSQ